MAVSVGSGMGPEPTPDFYMREGLPDKWIRRMGADADCEIEEGSRQFSRKMSNSDLVCSGKNLSGRLAPERPKIS